MMAFGNRKPRYGVVFMPPGYRPRIPSGKPNLTSLDKHSTWIIRHAK